MYLKPHAVVKVTERQVSPSAPPPPRYTRHWFLKYEVRENVTLMKHWMMVVMRDWSVCEPGS